jgi:uncharacterized membrane protein
MEDEPMADDVPNKIREDLLSVANAMHVAEVCMDRAGALKRSRLSVTAVGAEPLPAGWLDEVVVHTIRRNDDGTVTAICMINLYDSEHNCYTAERVIRFARRADGG